jgi:hypothetical protein
MLPPALPSWTTQETDWSALSATVAVKVWDWPTATPGPAGTTATPEGGGLLPPLQAAASERMAAMAADREGVRRMAS